MKLFSETNAIFNSIIFFVAITFLSTLIINSSYGSSDSPTIDSDNDGISEELEINGIDSNNDGIIDLNLQELGAKPDHKDIFVELDYMPGFKPIEGVIQNVVQSFSNAPVTNSDGDNGINLHVFIDEEIPLEDMVALTDIKNIKHNKFGTISERF